MAISFNNLRNINDTNLSQTIYRVTSGGTVFTALAVSAVDLWPDTGMVVGDYIMWKIVNQVNKPRGMRFHVSTAMAGVGITGAWEYRKSDGTWVAFAGLADATTSFQTAGTNLDVTWTVPTDWQTNGTAINAISGVIWWSFRFTAMTSYTEGGRLGNTTPAVTQVYDNAVRVDTNHEYSSGTATAGSTTTLTDSGKAFTVDALKMRHIYIHTGTGAGQVRVVKSNTATVVSVYYPWDTNPDATSQYRITANFNDLYDADVAGGWGVITKAGEHSYVFNCNLSIMAGAFGDCLANVEFVRNYYFYTQEAHTNAYQLHFGWRLPLPYGTDKGVWGNTIMGNRDTPLDSRLFGFGHADTLYAFVAGNRFILRHDYPYVPADGFIRGWFANRQKYSVNNYFEGWRSVTFPYASTESSSDVVTWCYSGVETPLAQFKKLKSYFNGGLGLFITGATNYSFEDFELAPTAYEQNSSIYASPIQFFAYTGTTTKLINLTPRMRPMADVFVTGSTGSLGTQGRIRVKVTDENKNYLPGATVRVSDSLLTNGKQKYFLNFDGVDDYASAPNNAAGNQFSGSTSFSVEAWVRTRSAGEGSNGRIIDKTGGGQGYQLLRSGSNFTFSVITSGGTKTSNLVTAVDGYWTHLVGVWNGSTIKLYADNITGTAVAAAGTATDDSANVMYFGNRSANDFTMNGHLARVRLFKNTALSASDVSTLFNNGIIIQNQASPIAGCTAEYNFRDASGSTLTDTYGNNATLGATTQAPTWFNTNTSLSTQNLTGTTGTEFEFLSGQAYTSGGLYSLSAQPSQATKLRLVVTNYHDVSAAGGANALFRITGTGRDGKAISEVIYVGEIGSGEFWTVNEYLTIDTLGIYVQGMSGTLSVDRKGIIYPLTADLERWRSTDDQTFDASEYNPIIIKVSRPGFEPVTIKKDVYANETLDVAMNVLLT